MKTTKTPHPIHMFFCTNTREDKSQSCGDDETTTLLAAQLKERFKKAGLPVRITRTGCLGPCAQGPNIMIFPQQIWLQKVHMQDLEEIEKQVEALAAAGYSVQPANRDPEATEV